MADDIWSGLDNKSGFERAMWGLFSFKGKMRRQGLFGYGLLANLITYPIFFIFVGPTYFAFIQAAAIGITPNVEPGAMFYIGLILVLVLSFWMGLANLIKRFRSMEYSFWLLLLLFVPIANIVIIIMTWAVAGKNHRENSASVFR